MVKVPVKEMVKVPVLEPGSKSDLLYLSYKLLLFDTSIGGFDPSLRTG
jgi:hypothetical protein